MGLEGVAGTDILPQYFGMSKVITALALKLNGCNTESLSK